MTTELIIPQHRLYLVNYNDIIQKAALKALEDIKWYFDLSKNNKLNKPVKQFILNHLIFQTCECILHKKTNNKIIFYISPSIPKSALHYFIDNTELDTFITKSIKQITKKLPIKFYISEMDFTPDFINHATLNSNLYKTHIDIIKNILLNECKSTKFTQIKDFCIKHGLTFLNERYFEDIKRSQIKFV